MSRFDATGQVPVDKWTAAPRLTTSPQAKHNNRSGQLICYINRSNQNVLDRVERSEVTYAIMCQAGKEYSLWLCKSHEQEHPDATARCGD